MVRRYREGVGAGEKRPSDILKAEMVTQGAYNAALVIGAAAGLYPSMRAARLSPTEALRTV